MQFYRLLGCQGPQIWLSWVASYSLSSQIIFGFLFSFAGVFIEFLIWKNSSDLLRRVVGVAAAAVLGPFAVLVLMFLISLSFYAPQAVLDTATSHAATEAERQAEKNHRVKESELSGTIIQLKEEQKTNPLVQELAAARKARDFAVRRSEQLQAFLNQLMSTAADVDQAAQEYERALEKEGQEWSGLADMSTGLDLKPGFTVDEALNQKHLFELSKLDVANAKDNLHQKQQRLRILTEKGP